MTALREQVMRILRELGEDPDFAADLIINAAEAEYSLRLRRNARWAATARWSQQQDAQGHALHDSVAPKAADTPHDAEGPAPKRAELLDVASQDASHSSDLLPLGGRGGLSSGSGSPPDLSRPKIGIRKNAHAGWEEFWALYPRKVGKAAAQRAWERHKPPLEPVKVALAWQAASDQWTRDGGAYIPHPATWLNGKRWEDQPMVPNGRNGGGGRWAAPHPGEHDYPVGEQKL